MAVSVMKSIECILYRERASKNCVIFIGKDNHGQCIVVYSTYNYELLEHEDKLVSISEQEFSEKYEPIPDDQENLDYYHTLIK